MIHRSADDTIHFILAVVRCSFSESGGEMVDTVNGYTCPLLYDFVVVPYNIYSFTGPIALNCRLKMCVKLPSFPRSVLSFIAPFG